MAALTSARARRTAALAAAACLCAGGRAPQAAAPVEDAAAPRIEARSADLVAVGVVHGDRMIIHVSRTIDNAPVRDATVEVLLRGATHPAVAESDGGYSLETPDLGLPGAAAVDFVVTRGANREELKGILAAAAPDQPGASGNSRQLGWWVLNFAVCFGFLWLWSRRKSAS